MDTQQILTSVLKGGICHFGKWQIRPFKTEGTNDRWTNLLTVWRGAVITPVTSCVWVQCGGAQPDRGVRCVIIGWRSGGVFKDAAGRKYALKSDMGIRPPLSKCYFDIVFLVAHGKQVFMG